MYSSRSISWLCLIVLSLASNFSLFAQLSGTKTIGGITPDYATITDAIAALETNGISGDVTFNIRDGEYAEQITVGNYTGNDNHQVVFQSESQDTSAVTLTHTAISNGEYTLLLDGARNITFQYLTIENVGGSQNGVLDIVDTRYLKILYNRLVFVRASTTDGRIINSNPVPFSDEACLDVEIAYNTFEDGYYGIFFNGNSLDILKNVSIHHNQLERQIANAISSGFADSVYVYDNTILSGEDVDDFGNSAGIYLDNISHLSVFNNTLDVQYLYGIVFSGCDPSSTERGLAYNNMVRLKMQESTFNGVGFFVDASTNINLLYNTVSVLHNSSDFFISRALMTRSSTVHLQNNIFANDKFFAIDIENISDLAASDYNNFYSAGGNLASITNIDVLTLAKWQDTTSLDGNSLAVDPKFVASDDLHINNNGALNGKANPVASVTTDIDGDARDTSQPDIGADEFEYINSDPVAVDDEFNVDEDATLSGNVLSNDTDAEEDSLQVTGNLTDPEFGELTLNLDGTFTYAPDTNYFGSDAFTYQVCTVGEDSVCVQAQVTITVKSVNDAPIAVDDTLSVTQLDTIYIDVLQNDTDLEQDSLTIVSLDATKAEGFAIIDEHRKSIMYVVTDPFVGTDSLMYSITDGEAESAAAWVVISVNVSEEETEEPGQESTEEPEEPDTVTSLDDDLTETRWQLYPNPVGDGLQLPQAHQVQHITWYDFTGRLVQTNVVDHQNAISVEKLTPGIYTAVIRFRDGSSITQKMIKR